VTAWLGPLAHALGEPLVSAAGRWTCREPNRLLATAQWIPRRASPSAAWKPSAAAPERRRSCRPCHKHRSPAVSSGQSRSLRGGLWTGRPALTCGRGGGRNCMACKGQGFKSPQLHQAQRTFSLRSERHLPEICQKTRPVAARTLAVLSGFWRPRGPLSEQLADLTTTRQAPMGAARWPGCGGVPDIAA
jgi:hypothetical protein